MRSPDRRPRAVSLHRVVLTSLAIALTSLLALGCDSNDSTVNPRTPPPLPSGTPGTWQDLGLSTGFVEVQALTTWQGDLVAGGSFYDVGGYPATSLASWDGATWTRLGPNFGGPVYAFAEYNGRLIVGGSFAHVNGDTLRNIAEWDGIQWRPLGSGTNRSVTALAVYGSDLIVGGLFDTAGGVPASYVARWDGAQWHALGSGFDSPPWALTIYKGDLIAGGSFTKASGVTASGIALWNGAWSGLGGGVSGGPSGLYGTVYALTVNADSLIAGGGFTSAGGVPAYHVAKWDGAAWDSLGSGIGQFSYEYVQALGMYADTLVAGGTFPGNVRKWSGSAWLPMGSLNGHVGAFAMHDSWLVAGGYFPKEGLQRANGIARWVK